MNDPGFRKFKTFRGSISAEGNSYAFDFRVSIESTGEIEFDLGTIPLSNETVFIKSLFLNVALNVPDSASQASPMMEPSLKRTGFT